jgi:8-amino-7-oxononanoate synthase/acyl carrier protein
VVDSLIAPFRPPKTNFVDRLRYWAEATPEDPAYTFLLDGETDAVTFTFAQADLSARAIAARLVELGMRGKNALLLYQPGIEFIIAFFACHYAGAVPIPAYPPRRNRNMGRIQLIAEDANASIALTTADVVERVKRNDMLDDSPSLKSIHWLATEQVPMELAGDWVVPHIDENSLAMMQYTSGSTGSPKGVMLSHRNLIQNCEMISTAFRLDLDSVGGSWLPMYHDMGLVGGVLNPLYCGRHGIYLSPVSFLAKPVRWLRMISNYRITISGGPNFAYKLCVDKVSDEELSELDLSCWRVAYNGAEPIRIETLEAFTDRFGQCGFDGRAHYPCYGMAETTLIVTGAVVDEPLFTRTFDGKLLDQHMVVRVDDDHPRARRLVGCGQVILDEDVIVVDPETCELASADQVGEIWVRSPGVGMGYWNNLEATQERFKAKLEGGDDREFLRTGDLGFFCDGELFVTGRLKDLIIIRGVNRYPQDIEATVESCSDRLRASGAGAFSIDYQGSERLVIVCEAERDRNNDWEDVLQKIRANVAEQHEVPPDAIVLVRTGSVPKTSSGKIQRHACRQSFLDDKLLEVARWCIWEEREREQGSAGRDFVPEGQDVTPQVAEIVMKEVREIAQERARNLSLDTNIVVDLGLDSLERLQIANSLEEIFGGRIPDDVLQEIESVREIAVAIEKHIGTEPRHLTNGAAEVLAAPKVVHKDIPEAFYQIDKMPEYVRLQRMKDLMASTGVRNPFFSEHQGKINATTHINGQELISFASYNYLGLSGTEEVSNAAKEAIDVYGTSASASRIVSGEKTIHKELESALAEFLQVEDVITFPGGHATNESVIGHLLGPGDLIIHDSLAHNSIIQGAALSGARRRPFEHNNWEVLDMVLEEIRHEYRRVMIAIEGLYSMDGDYPDLARFVEVKNKHKSLLYVDEAHSIGTLGETGRGLAELLNVPRSDVDLWMGTLSKSFGSCGGFVAGSSELVEYLRYTTPGFVFAAAIPPANVGAALGALKMLIREPERVARLRENGKLFLELAKQRGLNTGLSMGTPITPVITGDSLLALRLSDALFRRQINAQPILHPAVEEDQARLRFFITSEHTTQQITKTVNTIADEIESLRID